MTAPEKPQGFRERKRFVIIVIALVALLVVTGGAVVYGVFLRPWWRFNAYDRDVYSRDKMSDAELRDLCHLVIRFPKYGNAHDAFIFLARGAGDETSVPRLIRALGSAPAPGQNGFWLCTWQHCIYALESITNQKLGRVQANWQNWYAANKQKTRIEWIADGFGVPPKATPEAIQKLLPVVGPADPREYTMRNAFMLLDTYDRKMVCEQAAVAAKAGTPEAKRGAIWVAAHHDAPDLDEILLMLGKDSDHAVRWLALNHIADREARRLTNPPGSFVRSFRWDGEHWPVREAESDYEIDVPINSNRILVKSKKDGSEIASTSGRLICEEGGAIIAAEGGVARLLTLPDLDEKASFTVDGEIFGAAMGRDVVALLAMKDVDSNPVKERGWIEGWSMTTSTRIWGPIVLSEDRVTTCYPIVQADPEACYVSQDWITSAIRIADGEVFWQNAPEGSLMHAGSCLILEHAYFRGLDLPKLVALDARNGRLLACYSAPDGGTLRFRYVNGDELIAVDRDEKTGYVFRLPATEPETH